MKSRRIPFPSSAPPPVRLRSTAYEPGTRDALRLLRSCLSGNAGRVTLAVLGGVCYQLALISLPKCIEWAVDQGIAGDDDAAVRTWALVIVALGVAALTGEIVLGWFSTTSATLQGNRLYIALADRVSQSGARELDRFGEGDLSLRGTRDVDLIRTWLMGFASFVTGVFGFAVMIVAIVLLDPLLAVVGVACVPPLVWINTFLFPRRFGKVNTALSAAHGSRADAVEELLSASAAVRGLGGEPALVSRHHRRSEEVTEHTLRTARVSADWAALSPFVPALAIGAGLGFGGLAVLRGTMQVGGIVAFTSWMTMLVLWVGVLTMRLSQLSQATTAARRLQEILMPAGGAAPAGTRPLPGSGELAADGVAVRADGRDVLPPTSLAALPGRILAVTGPMGSGKTTLLRVLAGLVLPDRGTVRFAGVPLEEAEPQLLRRSLAFVPQRPVTLSGTLADNLRLGGDFTDDQLREACRLAALDGHLGSLPDGLETEVGEKGSTLSGGQLQRLALARALLRRPAVLLLDDITSAVDAATERTIVERLRQWCGEETAVVWATHRQAVADAADQVLALEAGTARVRTEEGAGAGG
ncbi:ABC transporter ATP-binding protein [Streptomyces sp. HNM0575]|uniref:ABC transporter ATP-binding protein n=1 Tax=Streptomyces sp. HNM0575 TaxID=2716338 RepID=UPI00145F28CA|nr:ABC transporter ATP-binding protein [Streptomyces sp. HNM0575]NLU73390.1 ABC transporter ATP-binding protein [Streptomyces sp. HNM0575]